MTKKLSRKLSDRLPKTDTIKIQRLKNPTEGPLKGSSMEDAAALISEVKYLVPH